MSKKLKIIIAIIIASVLAISIALSCVARFVFLSPSCYLGNEDLTEEEKEARYLIFNLDLEKIKELQSLLNKFCETINKSKTDTKMLRALFKSGEYNSVADFLMKEKQTKDNRKY